MSVPPGGEFVLLLSILLSYHKQLQHGQAPPCSAGRLVVV